MKGYGSSLAASAVARMATALVAAVTFGKVAPLADFADPVIFAPAVIDGALTRRHPPPVNFLQRYREDGAVPN